MSDLSNLSWRVNQYKGTIAFVRKALQTAPTCAKANSLMTLDIILRHLTELEKQIELDYQSAKEKIQNAAIIPHDK